MSIKVDFPPLDYGALKLQTKLFKTSPFQFATTWGKKVKKKLLTINESTVSMKQLDHWMLPLPVDCHSSGAFQGLHCAAMPGKQA